LAAVIKPIYAAPNTEAAAASLDAFEAAPMKPEVPDRHGRMV